MALRLALALALQSTIASLAAGVAPSLLELTVRQRYMPATGRQRWVANETAAHWLPSQTAVVVVDMWNDHWCKTDAVRIREIATPINETLAAARALGVHVVHAPSGVTAFYARAPARLRTSLFSPIFHRFELDLLGHTPLRGAALSCPRLKLADMVLI